MFVVYYSALGELRFGATLRSLGPYLFPEVSTTMLELSFPALELTNLVDSASKGVSLAAPPSQWVVS